MISQTKLKTRISRKTNPELVETLNAVRKNKAWEGIARFLSGSARKYKDMNLFEIDSKTKAGDTVVVLGKVLSKGDLSKKVVICGLSISENAREKLKESKSEFKTIFEEIKKNPKAEGVKIL